MNVSWEVSGFGAGDFIRRLLEKRGIKELGSDFLMEEKWGEMIGKLLRSRIVRSRFKNDSRTMTEKAN